MADLGINSSSSSAYTTQVSSTSQAPQSAAASDKKEESAKNQTDTVEISNQTKAEDKNKIKNPNQRDSATIEKLKAEAEAKISSFKNLVENLFKKQGVSGAAAQWDGKTALKDYLEKAFSNGVNASDVEQAKKDVAEGGYWSVEKTGDRILDFAKALIGDDMSKFDKIKKAILGGFGAAQDAWGDDKMPQITKDTLDYITKRLDEWEKNGTTADVSKTVAPDVTGLNK